MKTMALLQNQYFNDPVRAAKLLQRYIEHEPDVGRHQFVADMLFMGCKTGQRILRAFGEDFARSMVFEETSTQMGGHAASSFPIDFAHVISAIHRIKPGVLVTFGVKAMAAATHIEVNAILDREKIHVYHAPHPAARHATVEAELAAVAMEVRRRCESINA